MHLFAILISSRFFEWKAEEREENCTLSYIELYKLLGNYNCCKIKVEFDTLLC